MEVWNLDDVIDLIREDSTSCDLNYHNNFIDEKYDWSNNFSNNSLKDTEISSENIENEQQLIPNIETLKYDDLFNLLEGEAFYDDDDDDDGTSCFSVSSNKVSIEVNAPTKCAICGDPTNCCHYDVPSCSGCKTFFRRSIVDNRKYTCKNHGKCQITRGNRCRSCRLDKCIFVGMNPSAIKFPNDSNVEDALKYVNERKRTFVDDTKEKKQEESSTSLMAIQKKIPILNQTIEIRDLEFLIFLESKIIKMRESNFNPRPLYKMKIGDILARKTVLKYSDKYEKPEKWPKHDLSFTTNISKLNFPQFPPPKHWFVVDLILIIESAKIIPIFEKLDFLDKELVMKEVILLNTLLFEAYYSMTKHHDTIIMPDGFMPIKNSGHINLPEKILQEIYCRIIEPLKRINICYEEYLILKAIIFCNPTVKKISEKSRKLLEKESEKYSKILMKYLQTTYGNSQGAVRYVHIIAIFEAMTHFGQKYKEFHVVILLKLKQLMETMGKKFVPHLHILDEVMK